MSDDGSRVARRVVIGSAVVLGLVLAVPLFALGSGYYRHFYLPSENMAPTLVLNDRVLASMTGPGELRRGDIVLIAVNDQFYVKRVAALPGDRIAMQEGVVILNGRPVAQRFLHEEPYESSLGTRARRLAEQFPAEAQAHEIYDLQHTEFDDMDEQIVARDRVFVLGDNRDMSADSRVPRDMMGLEQVPLTDVRGLALYRTWGANGWSGEKLNR